MTRKNKKISMLLILGSKVDKILGNISRDWPAGSGRKLSPREIATKKFPRGTKKNNSIRQADDLSPRFQLVFFGGATIYRIRRKKQRVGRGRKHV